jgi:hypothetical protein
MFDSWLGFSLSRTHVLVVGMWLLSINLMACTSQSTPPAAARTGNRMMSMPATQTTAPSGGATSEVMAAPDSGLLRVSTLPAAKDAGPCLTCDPPGGQYCGSIGDNCNTKLDCGECKQDGYTCGGHGIEHVCGASPDSGKCSLISCDPPNGRYCDVIGDGCGGALDCGACPGNMECGAAGLPNLCATPLSKGCVPLICSDGNSQYCGVVGDGCGGALDCGACGAGLECGARIERLCGVPCPLCKMIKSCQNGETTTVTGTAVTGALMNADPLYNAVVYIPNIDIGQQLVRLPDGPSCNTCSPLTLDNSVASAITGPDGKFTLKDVPVGKGIPLIVQLGSWRMQTTIGTEPCVENALPVGSVRLPRNQGEGDIPLTAIATGDVDRLQCLMRKIGIEDSEFTDPSGMGRIHMFVSNGSRVSDMTPLLTDLAGINANDGVLNKYTQVLLPCEGLELAKPANALTHFTDYVNKGGRAFATHYSYTWLFMNASLATTAMWQTQPFRAPNMEMMALNANIDTTFQKGADFAQWLQLTGALANAMPPQIAIQEYRTDVAAVPAMSGGQRWIYADDPASVQHYTVDTPVGATGTDACGRVVFSDFHVLNARTSGMMFPAECDANPLTAQEKVLEFMLFDLASCIGPNTPPAPPPPPPPPPPAAPPPPLPPPPVL